MAVFYNKLIELLNIETHAEQSYLRIRIASDQDLELLWKIDNATAENLKAATVFDGNYRYRLSFNGSWDYGKEQYVSFMNRTYRDQSEKVYFTCSEDYVKALEAIKRQEINSMDNLSFLSMNLPQEEEPKQVQELQEPEKTQPKRKNHKFTWVAAACISVISIVLIGFSGHTYFAQKESTDEKVVAEAKMNESKANVENEEPESKTDSTNTESTSTKPADPEKDKPAEQSEIPLVELGNGLTYSIPDGSVALTFDDGPSRYSKKLVDILKEYQVGGTFFFIGMNVKKNPEYVRYVNSNGFSIGTHSMNHVNVSQLSYKKQEHEVMKATQLVEAIINEEVDLFRPPYGKHDQLTQNLINEHNRKMVLWNKDPKDWKSENANRIINYIKRSDMSGSIIILHETQATIDALPQIIEYLQGQGLEIVNLT
ncbi:polysaccharide deacetylase family protein [Virgibacillus doumboii]|uniref:polysaccharide deacetylase family protein n=1 Tax=Virgibacillus doumboii TaxID=2697503 RepID=UPI0013DF452A|nr:polysaccharide deacetylase family protein [Virgibacillus doumboii]